MLQPLFISPTHLHSALFYGIIMEIMDLNTIFIIGPQGSGKGTQARALAARLGFFHWDMGAILRETAASGSDIGNKVKELVDNGIYLSDEFLIEVCKDKLNTISPSQGVIFDGIPRRLGQAEYLLEFLKSQGRKNFVTLFVNVPREESLNRLSIRTEKEGRADDTKEKIEKRLEQYENETVPVLDFLKTHTVFYQINGKPPVEEVTVEIASALGVSN